ncbi:hypothetical protein [Streptomyces sp. GZWMJZ-114]|uniref:hypothetical protein n=1 Tax=Streptomyces sp. GZWMJZ-114 TaxID=2494734 RepID=UPI001012F73A|nr:hypothetical protein [Streptomyces sp. GZWMJZ-114]
MATSLAESAILSSENLQRGVIEAFIQTSPILDRLTPINFEGTAFRYNEESKLPGDSFRAVNEAYPESTGAVSPRIENLALGCAAMTDKLSIEVSDYPNFPTIPTLRARRT